MQAPRVRARRILGLAILITPLALVRIAGVAGGLPMFGGRSGAACSRCHGVTPELNDAGIAFQQRGYREPGEHAGLPRSLRDLPISVVGSAGAGISRPRTFVAGAPEHITTESVTGSSIALHAAGTLTGRLSYHFDLDTVHHEEEIVNHVAFAQFDDVLRNGGLNVRGGRFDAELPFLSSERRTTIRDYLSPVTFQARGFELNGAAAAWTYAAGLIESDRHVTGPNTTARIGDQIEDTYYRVTRDVGGNPVAAQMLFDKQDSDMITHTWLQHIQARLAAQLGPPRWTVTPSYILDRFDDRPAAGIHEHHHYFMLESVTQLDTRRLWSVTARGEYDYRVANAVDAESDRRLGVLTLARSVTPYARIAAEWSREQDTTPHRIDDALGAMLELSY